MLTSWTFPSVMLINVGYYRADPAAYAFSQRLCVYGIWPTGTAKGTDRWWSSPARAGYGRDPRQSDPTHTTGALHGSAPERSRRRCANRARHWRRPTWSVIPDRESPYGRAFRQRNADKLLCLEGHPDKSVGRTPSPDTDPSTKSRAVAHRRRIAPRNGEIRDLASSSEVERRRFGLGSRTIVFPLSTQTFDPIAIQIAASQFRL